MPQSDEQRTSPLAIPLHVLRRLGGNLSGLVRRGVARAALSRRNAVWVMVRLNPPLDELRPPLWPGSRNPPQSLLELLETLETAGRDPRVAGVLVRLGGAPDGWAKLGAVRRAIEKLAAHKPVVAYGETLRIEDLALGSAASELWMPEAGMLQLVGLRAEAYFVRGLLEQLGVQPEVLRIGSHKAGAEMFTRDGMSPEQREQMEALLDDLFEELVSAIATGRELDPEKMRELIDAGPYRAGRARELGLLDACIFPDEVEKRLETLVEGERPVRMVEGAHYHALRATDSGWLPLLSDAPRVAYVVASGAIRRGHGLRGVASDAFRQLLERVRKDQRIQGVVLRIESPGGDSLASDLIWRAVRVTAQDKPVVVTLGDVAASGGYYVAAAGDSILAEAGTLTGSIGVLGGKLNLEGLYEKLGIAKEAVERGARAGMTSETRRFTPDERNAMRDDMKAVYELFLSRVAEGRGLERDRLEPHARGRVWSGARAKALGLVDSIGGPLEALGEVRRRMGLAEDARIVVEVHPRLPWFGGLRSLAGLFLGGRGI